VPVAPGWLPFQAPSQPVVAIVGKVQDVLAEDPAAVLLDGVQEFTVAGSEEVDGRPCTHLVAQTEAGTWDL
jgi:hypothetical protein